VDVGAIGQEALKETAYIGHLRNVDALIHVLRAFEDPAIPHVGAIDPLRDIKNVEFDSWSATSARSKTAGAPGKRPQENAHARSGEGK